MKRVHSGSRHNEKREMRLCLCVCSTFVHITKAQGRPLVERDPQSWGKVGKRCPVTPRGDTGQKVAERPSAVATTVAPVFVSRGDSGGLRKQCFLRLTRVTKIHPEENTVVITPMYGKF